MTTEKILSIGPAHHALPLYRRGRSTRLLKPQSRGPSYQLPTITVTQASKFRMNRLEKVS